MIQIHTEYVQSSTNSTTLEKAGTLSFSLNMMLFTFPSLAAAMADCTVSMTEMRKRQGHREYRRRSGRDTRSKGEEEAGEERHQRRKSERW